MELPIFNTFINFYHHRFCCFTIASLSRRSLWEVKWASDLSWGHVVLSHRFNSRKIAIYCWFVLDKSMAWNRCLQHPCFKNVCKIAQASKNLDSSAQHFLSDLLKHSWFHSMLFALPGYQFPYIVMNRCFYLMWHSHFLMMSRLIWGDKIS
jgi:hypothetical protein